MLIGSISRNTELSVPRPPETDIGLLPGGEVKGGGGGGCQVRLPYRQSKLASAWHMHILIYCMGKNPQLSNLDEAHKDESDTERSIMWSWMPTLGASN